MNSIGREGIKRVGKKNRGRGRAEMGSRRCWEANLLKLSSSASAVIVRYAEQNSEELSEINRTHLSEGFFNFISQLQLQLLQSESSQRLDEKTIVIMHINT